MASEPILRLKEHDEVVSDGMHCSRIGGKRRVVGVEDGESIDVCSYGVADVEISHYMKLVKDMVFNLMITHDRIKIENEFFGEKICGVAATNNALELGIDVGHIDVTLHLGFPGIIA
ncbi:hypothetical protein Tco_1227030, partial [Tanacetum coccineum]